MENVLFRKTWKRETAIALLAWLVGMITWIVIADLPLGVELIKTMIVPVLGLAAAMFGVQAYQNVSAAQYEQPPTPATYPTSSAPPTTEAAKNAPFRPGMDDH